jgi:hypothetical protein
MPRAFPWNGMFLRVRSAGLAILSRPGELERFFFFGIGAFGISFIRAFSFSLFSSVYTLVSSRHPYTPVEIFAYSIPATVDTKRETCWYASRFYRLYSKSTSNLLSRDL